MLLTLQCQHGHMRQQHAVVSIPHCQPGSRWHHVPKGRSPSPCCHLYMPVNNNNKNEYSAVNVSYSSASTADETASPGEEQ